MKAIKITKAANILIQPLIVPGAGRRDPKGYKGKQEKNPTSMEVRGAQSKEKIPEQSRVSQVQSIFPPENDTRILIIPTH